jgi:hypothetical protein
MLPITTLVAVWQDAEVDLHKLPDADHRKPVLQAQEVGLAAKPLELTSLAQGLQASLTMMALRGSQRPQVEVMGFRSVPTPQVMLAHLKVTGFHVCPDLHSQPLAVALPVAVLDRSEAQ